METIDRHATTRERIAQKRRMHKVTGAGLPAALRRMEAKRSLAAKRETLERRAEQAEAERKRSA